MVSPAATSTGKSISLYFAGLLSKRRESDDGYLASTRRLGANPEIYPPDKYRNNNDGSFRAYELHHYRIAYRITEKEIIITRMRHTSMEPKQY